MLRNVQDNYETPVVSEVDVAFEGLLCSSTETDMNPEEGYM